VAPTHGFALFAAAVVVASAAIADANDDAGAGFVVDVSALSSELPGVTCDGGKEESKMGFSGMELA
jgi:hypothetical protein